LGCFGDYIAYAYYNVTETCGGNITYVDYNHDVSVEVSGPNSLKNQITLLVGNCSKLRYENEVNMKGFSKGVACSSYFVNPQPPASSWIIPTLSISFLVVVVALF
jgi:hypothetical protein